MKQRKVRIKSIPMIYAPGVFRWVREAVAPFNKKKAAAVLEGLGLNPTDAKFLANHKNEVTTTLDGEDLLLDFTIA